MLCLAEEIRQESRVTVYRALLQLVGNGTCGLARPPRPTSKVRSFLASADRENSGAQRGIAGTFGIESRELSQLHH